MRTLLVGLVLASMLSITGTAGASNDQAELHRLEHEMGKLARRNAWRGVESAYNSILKLKKVEIGGDTHMLGAEAARDDGRIGAYIKRLWRAEAKGNADATTSLKATAGIYGRVLVKGKKGAELTKNSMPFAPDQARVVRNMIEQVKSKGKYDGWLPVGDYKAGDKAFAVKLADWTKATKCVKDRAKKSKDPRKCIKKIKKQKFKVK